MVAGGWKPRAGGSCRETGRVVAKNLHACMLQSRHDPPSRGSLAARYQSDGLPHTPHKLYLVVPRNARPGGAPRGCCLPQTCACVPVAVRREPLRVDARVDAEAEHVHHVPVLRDHLGYDRRRVRPQRPRVVKDDDGRGRPPGLLLRFPEARKRAACFAFHPSWFPCAYAGSDGCPVFKRKTSPVKLCGLYANAGARKR